MKHFYWLFFVFLLFQTRVDAQIEKQINSGEYSVSQEIAGNYQIVFFENQQIMATLNHFQFT